MGVGVDPMLPGLGVVVLGEAVGGIHGRNRLRGNSLLDIIVFGRNAGQQAAKKSRQVKVGKLTLAHVDAFAEELSKAGIQPDTVSPRLLPTYTHGREKAIEGIAVK